MHPILSCESENMQKDEHVQEIRSCSHARQWSMDVMFQVNNGAITGQKSQTCLDMPLQHNWTGYFLYDMTHALIILSEVNVGIAQDAPYSVSTEDLLRMVVMFQGNETDQ